MDIVMQYVLLVVCLFLSGFFSGAETAFVGLSRIKVHELVKNGEKNAKALLRLKENSHKVIITILIGNNLVNILASALATSVAITLFGNEGVGIAVGVMTFLILIVGEIVPKSYAATNPKRVSMQNARVLLVLMMVFTPLIWFFEKINLVVFRLFGGTVEPKQITEDDIINAISLSEQDGAIKAQERELLHNVFEFDDTTVEEIMTPREQVFVLDTKTKFKDALDKMIQHGFSRVPVYRSTPERIVKVLHIKDAFHALTKGRTPKTIVSLGDDPFFVPETKKINSLLSTFQKKKTHMAVVINEYGGFVGIVTLEDLLEELVGEIYDEFDKDAVDIKKVSENEYIVRGDCEIEAFNKMIKPLLPEDEDYQTVAGFLMKRLGRMPKQGDKIRRDDFTLIVMRASDRYVHAVKLILK